MATTFKRNFDLAIFALLVAGFTLIAAQRLAEVPVPQVDESYMLHTSYEMLDRGKLSLPFRRFLGGNIENNWHSLTPVHYVIQTAFFKVFGWGIGQGRAFNLILAMIVLLLVHLIGRKLFDWRVGLIAVVMIITDVFFLERSHFLRNDYSAVMFALLAFYLYEAAERRRDWRLFAGSGLAAGAALMCHTAALYIIAAIALLMFARRGWRVVKAKGFYLFALGALAVSAYEIVSDILDWANFRQQYHGDKRHFKLLDAMGWLRNISHEPQRYRRWYAAGSMYSDVPRTLSHLFQYLTIISLAYLAVRMIARIRRGNLTGEPRNRLLIVTLTVVSFFAIITSQKAVYYVAHLTPWFALAVGLMMRDGLDLIDRLRTAGSKESRLRKLAYNSALAGSLIFAGMFGYQAVKLYKRYVTNVRSPDAAQFDELKAAIRSIVPGGVCPVEVGDPVLWLAFLEHHLRFAYIEERMEQNVDIDGKEYAMIVDPRIAGYWLKAVAANHNHLLGELNNTPYGDLQVYYTGADPSLLALAPVRYQFFGKRRGHLSEGQLAGATEVWSAGAAELGECAKLSGAVEPEGLLVETPRHGARADGLVELCSIDLKPDTIYQLAVDAKGEADGWTLLMIDRKTGAWLQQKRIGEPDTTAGPSAPRVFDGVFKTGRNNRMLIGVMPRAQEIARPFHISRIRIREIPSAPSAGSEPASQ